MTERTLIRTGVGAIQRINPFKTLDDAFNAIQTIVSKINDEGISLGNGIQSSRAGNMNAQTIDWIFPNAADVEQEIPHSLARVPIGYWIIRRDRACIIYDSSTGAWSPTRFFLKSNVANAIVRILVF